MNKQELIKKYEKECEMIYGFPVIRLSLILEDLKQLDEPQKPVVPQFVADYIDFKKTYDFHVYGAMRVIEDHHDKRVQEWFYEGNIETFARAWLDGYEIEKEKRYLVKIKGIKSNECYLNCIGNERNWIISDKTEYNHIITEHTRKELEDAGFGEVFNSPLFEVEEVEE